MHLSSSSNAVVLLYLLVAKFCRGFVIPREHARFISSNHNSIYDTAVLSTIYNQNDLHSSSLSTKQMLSNVLDKLRCSPNLPYHFMCFNSGKETRLCVRNLEMMDLKTAVQLCLKEYGSYPSYKTSDEFFLLKWIQDRMNHLDNFIFSFVVLLGLSQRIERREQCISDSSLPQDHNVVCISEIDDLGCEKIFGMAELSLQSSDPSRTSPPFVIPSNLKKVLGLNTPYISNVLITNEYRGYGYSKILMAACEGLASSWGYKEVYLHVDASSSGVAAQNLYVQSGYRPIVNEKYNKNFSWMGIDHVNRGLYIVDGVALLFLKKNL